MEAPRPNTMILSFRIAPALIIAATLFSTPAPADYSFVNVLDVDDPDYAIFSIGSPSLNDDRTIAVRI